MYLFTCNVCDFQTSDMDMLKAHGNSHDSPSTLIRPFLKDSIKNNNNCSTDVVMIQCTECGFIAQEKSTMTDHMWNHLKKDIKLSSDSLPKASLKSEFCLPFTQVLTSSFLSSFTQSALIYKCTECSFLSKEANTLFSHMLQHKKEALGDIIPSTKQSLLDVGTTAVVAAVTTTTTTTSTTTTTTVEDSISSLSLSTTSESSLRNVSSDSVGKTSFLHDQVAKHFQCTICGYTCELQRTIKAHIWKHSGHRDVDYPMFQNGPLSIYEDINKHKPFIPNLKTKDKSKCQVFLNSENPAIVSQVSKVSTSSCPQNVSAMKTFVTTTMSDIANLHNENPIPSEGSSMMINGEKDKSKISEAIEVDGKHKIQEPVPSKSLVLSSCPVKTDQISNKPNLMNVTPMDDTNGLLSLMEFKENTKMMPKRNCDSTENAFYQPLRKKNCIETFSNPTKDFLYQKTCSGENLDKIPKEDILNCKNQSSTENNNDKNVIFVTSEKKFQKSKVVKINKTEIDSISQSGESILEETTDDQFLSPVPTLDILATNPKNLCSVVPENNQLLETCSLPEITSENREENKSASFEKDEEHDKESAVALLSLLKHLSTFKSRSESSVVALTSNTTDKYSVTTPQPVNAAVPLNTTTTITSGITNVTTTVTMTASDVKPKMGISSSLLAVIEQLREHSKLENEKSNTCFSNQPHTKHNDDNDSSDNISLAPTKTFKKIFAKAAEDDVLQMELKNIEQVHQPGDCKMHFRCKLCHYTNANRNHLLQHMQFHCAKKPFECSFCQFVAKSSNDLQNHMIHHCKLQIFQCKWCSMTFNCKSQLRIHMNTHCKREPFVCKYCQFEAEGQVAYQEHLLQMHPKKAVHFCISCKEHFLCKLELQNHQKTTCNGRKKTQSNDKNYSSNKLNIEQTSKVTRTEIVCCTKCGQSFSSLIEKEKHSTFVCCKEWLCQKCNFSTNSFVTFQNHIQLHCNKKSSLKCNMCNFTALSSRSLKSHMKRHVNHHHLIQQLLEQYKCNLCGYVCHHLPSLKSHMWRHASDKNYSYVFTNEVINEAIDYDSHLEHFVDSEDSGSDTTDPQSFLNPDTANNSVSQCMVTFRCCQCGFETINKATLNNHMKSHVGVIEQTPDVYQIATGNNQQPFLNEMKPSKQKGAG